MAVRRGLPVAEGPTEDTPPGLGEGRGVPIKVPGYLRADVGNGRSRSPGVAFSARGWAAVDLRWPRSHEKQRAKDREIQDHRDEGEDESMQRQRSLLLLSALASDALDEIAGLVKEAEVLQQMVRDKKDERQGERDQDAAPRRSAANTGEGLQVTHISRVGGNLEIRKESVRASVLRPTVELPSMTVEEFGEVELLRSRQVKAAEKALPPSRRRYDQLEKDGDEDNEGLVEQAVRYDREWDDWKDDHPRGSGNKANKRI